MRHNPMFAETDPAFVRTLIAENPWATIVSDTGDGMVASHYPVLLDEGSADLAVVTHLGRPDETIHRLAAGGEVLLIIAGPHGYISPSWYTDQRTAPTWNFSTVHAYGVPEILSDDENLRVLSRLVDHFEQHVDEPTTLDPDVGAALAPGTIGLRIPVTRFTCKVKMSQGKDPQTRSQILEQLRRPDGHYADPRLADDMQRALDRADRLG